MAASCADAREVADRDRIIVSPTGNPADDDVAELAVDLLRAQDPFSHRVMQLSDP